MTTSEANPYALTLYVLKYGENDETELLLGGDALAAHLGKHTGAISVVNVMNGANVLEFGAGPKNEPIH